MNPPCPEPKCRFFLQLKTINTNLGIQMCPNCGNDTFKKYILTPSKVGMGKCMKCRKDFKLKYRHGRARCYICKEHPWQKFKVGEAIIRKYKPKSEEEINNDVLPESVDIATKRRSHGIVRT